MRHSLRLDGFAYRLRPVDLADAEFVVDVRTRDPERVRFLHAVSPDVGKQLEWLARYHEREHDYYWVIERLANHQPEGLAGIYDVNPVAGTAEWGRWVLRKGSFAAAESALLIYRAAFELLDLRSVYCITVADNQPVLSFHDSCGLRRVEVLRKKFTLADGVHDGVKHACTREDWPAILARLEPHARRVAQRLNRIP